MTELKALKEKGEIKLNYCEINYEIQGILSVAVKILENKELTVVDPPKTASAVAAKDDPTKLMTEVLKRSKLTECL